MDNFLITYDSGIYRFFTEDKEGHTLSLSTFGVRIIPAVIQEEDDNFYMREITDTGLKTAVLDIETQGATTINLNINDYIIDYTDKSFVIANEEIISSSFNVVGGQATVTLMAPAPSTIRVNFSYYSSIALVEGRNYELTIDSDALLTLTCQSKNDVLYIGDYDYFMGEDEDIPSTDTIVFNENPKLIDEHISANQNQYQVIFGETGETGTEYNLYTQTSESQSDAYIGNRYLYDGSSENTEEPFFIITKEIQWFSYVLSEELIDEEIYYHIISENLVSVPNRVDLPKYYRKWYEEGSQIITVDYCISCIDDESLVSGQDYYTLNMSGPEAKSTTAKNYSENLSDKTWLYTTDSIAELPKEYDLLIESYNVILIPELAGVALVSFGRKEKVQDYVLTKDIRVIQGKAYYELIESEYVEVQNPTGNPLLNEWYEYIDFQLQDNYGIGINSGDENLTLPPKAISLFEAQFESAEEDEDKIKLDYRGILGTLPSDLDLYPGIASNLIGTQGIYTNNMYIGDSEQYVAYYRDSTDNYKPKLDIKGSVHIGSGILNDIVSIENGGISLGNPNGFHIFIDGERSHKKTWGLGFYAGSHSSEYALTTDERVVPDKDYYTRNGETYTKVNNPTGNPSARGWYEEKDKRIAYIDADRLLVPYTVVLNGTEIGNEWMWELQEDTKNLTLKWIGEDWED